jgi:hypothetical protein
MPDRDASEQVIAIAGMRTFLRLRLFGAVLPLVGKRQQHIQGQSPHRG